MWFLFALLTTLAWGGADMFYKLGSNPEERYSHLKIVVMVGAVMGIHAISFIITNPGGISFTPADMLRYFPVSFFYITSMAVGYFGLRYLELSVSSPVQNSSGAVTAIMVALFFVQSMSVGVILAIAVICAGVFMLGLIEKRQSDAERLQAGEVGEKKYRSGILAIFYPLMYCVLDAMGTFLDAVYLGEAESEARFSWLSRLLSDFNVMDEDAALLAYEFTFLAVGILAYLFLRYVKKEKFNLFRQPVRTAAAVLETAGQYFYVYAMSGRAVVAAPMIASYSIVSVLLSRIFLKEKLTRLQYAMILLVMGGIAWLGFLEG